MLVPGIFKLKNVLLEPTLNGSTLADMIGLTRIQTSYLLTTAFKVCWDNM